ncbi:FUSC family protein [Nesterenkonia xinjiangensis]|uniref:Uncharacterized membrane protein YgaE (UPF0421/DUF939 family) n=1 Tax=Nesterenkonia xinjiangensis TaxID=225327 RepID=A0A7Z0GMG6_9MICC|nr:uncharacterized membrane protein YgaE (UPF0421/DUF939 family) [Nesterenkonia xinjiangensis]
MSTASDAPDPAEPRRSGLLAYLRHGVRTARRVTTARVRAGGVRAGRSVVPALQMTVAGVGAFALAETLLGHDGPLFAAVAALIALGFTKEPRLRKVVEVALGCTLGIFIGDLVLHFFGAGLLTASFVLFVSIMLARLLDNSSLLAMQMGLQALLVVLIPAPEGGLLGPFSRSADAVLGGTVAMLIALLTPKDPRREPIRELRRVVDDLTRALRETAKAIRTSESREAWHALIRCRGIQSQLDDAVAAVASAEELTRYSPAYRRHRHYVRRMGRLTEKMDLAVRSMRVITRRAVSMVDNASLTDEATESLSSLLEEFADAVQLLSRAVSESGPASAQRMEVAQHGLSAVATRLHPTRLEIHTLEGESVVLMLRTMIVDVMEAAGLTHEEAEELLPALGHRDTLTGRIRIVKAERRAGRAERRAERQGEWSREHFEEDDDGAPAPQQEATETTRSAEGEDTDTKPPR